MVGRATKTKETNQKWRCKMKLDFEFRKEVMEIHIQYDGLQFCSQCGSCTEICPELNQASFDPRVVLTNALLGYKDEIQLGQEIPKRCNVECKKCGEICPQHIRIPELMDYLKTIRN